jgi:outer membrane protein OmpA-like peptidoglycan-associated protein
VVGRHGLGTSLFAEAADQPVEALAHLRLDLGPVDLVGGVGRGLVDGVGAPDLRMVLGLRGSMDGLLSEPVPEPTPVAVEPAPAPAAPERTTGWVKVVASTTDGSPVDARVQFTGPTNPETLQLGEDGQEEIELPHGTYQVLISAEALGATLRTIELKSQEYDKVLFELILQPGKVEVTAEGLEISEKVHFDVNKAVVKPESLGLLSEVAYTLMAHPHIQRVEVQGHTDNQGDDAYNLELSQRRVEAVRKVMIEKGVAPERLVAKGYGESLPIASNADETGQAKNRRVQFVILEQQEEGDEAPTP